MPGIFSKLWLIVRNGLHDSILRLVSLSVGRLAAITTRDSKEMYGEVETRPQSRVPGARFDRFA